MYHFKQEWIKQLPVFAKKYWLVVSRFLLSKRALIIVLSVGLTACSQMMTQRRISHNLINTPGTPKSAQSTNSPNKPVDLTGQWKIGYRYQGKSDIGSMRIQQNKESFSGQGKDEQSGAVFKIEQGSIRGNEILFLKRYDKRPGQVVQYHGQFSYLSPGDTSYMGGDFSFEENGSMKVGDWEAAMAQEKAPPVVVPEPENKIAEPEESQQVINRIPDLSGKWNVAYEYNFKTMHSTMFLEQDGHKVSGHGIDNATKRKFIIKKGWYDFPHLTLVKQYLAGSAVGGESLIVFKADVSEVSDKDYTGPYLSGKTQGGGEWEAERAY